MTIAPAPEAVADPTALSAAAHRLAAEGSRLRAGTALLGRTVTALSDEGWSGSAADAFAGSAAELVAAGQGAADLLDRVEAALHQYAAAAEAARIDQVRAAALGMPPGPAAALSTAQLRLQVVLSDAAREAHGLRHRLAAAAPAPPARLAGPLAAPPAGSPLPVQAAPAGEAVLTLGVLAALLASPGDPTGAGSVAAPVRAALARPLRRLLAEEEAGWHRPLAVAACVGRRPATARGQVAAAVAAALRPTGADGPADGWRLPERG